MRIQDFEADDVEVRDDNLSEEIDVNEDEERNDEDRLMGNYVSVADLKKEVETLLQKIQESSKNLRDQKNFLEALKKENDQDEIWQAQFDNVEKFIVLNHNFKEAKIRRIDLIRKELKRLESLKKKAAKHMRSKHTKEQMFSCDRCSINFQTMNAKMANEKSHQDLVLHRYR